MKITGIPERYHFALKLLVELEDEVIEEIVESLGNNISPLLNIEEITHAVANQVTQLDVKRAEKITDFILSLYLLFNDSDFYPQEFVDSLLEFLRTSQEFSQKFTEFQLQRFSQRLLRVMEQGGVLAVLSKAANVILEQERIFLKARVISDIRPIFDRDIEKGPASATIIHTLKLEYRQADESKELFLALDSIDIKHLQEQLNRAEKKAKVLRQLIERANVNYLEIEE
ncbi:hypothetical protein NG796_19475 [Laspinema sp. A4]|uniref:hypothetical protein n=1 Tax=Laspinema sp. D2d TaxID=2953686 RepID=UPI0021BA831A|nr:hypothetical protein [Laspinema sp. D2d]MCT7985459.1 hypothetical protein [Laspinema sp. D2d]